MKTMLSVTSKQTEKRMFPGSDLGKYFCVSSKVEIRKDAQFVKDCLINDYLSCVKWHPAVKDTCYKDASLANQIGGTRKCMFFEDSSGPAYLWEELVHKDDDSIMYYIQDENFPTPMKYLGGTVKVREVDDKHAEVTFTITYVPKGLPFTGFLARGSIRKQFSEHVYELTQGIKYHCETGQIASANKVHISPMFQFRKFKNLYDLQYSDASTSIPTIKDPLQGKTRFSGIFKIEIKKPLTKVREILWNHHTCPFWHPFVGSTELKDPEKADGPGSVRKCKFYDELVSEGKTPEFVWDECLDDSGNRLILNIQAENRPSILDAAGKVFYLEEIDPDHTMLTVYHYFTPKFMPLTRLMATKMMKKPVLHDTYRIAWCVKYHCETGKEARYDMVPDLVGFKEFEDCYDTLKM